MSMTSTAPGKPNIVVPSARSRATKADAPVTMRTIVQLGLGSVNLIEVKQTGEAAAPDAAPKMPVTTVAQIQAKPVDDQRVVIVQPDGQTQDFARDRLSAKDQQYVQAKGNFIAPMPPPTKVIPAEAMKMSRSW